MLYTISCALLILQLLFLNINSSSALQLQIFPPRAHITAGTRLKVMCMSDVPLVGCQFKRTFVSPIYDLSRGPLTPPTTEYSYYGTGLQAGECGIVLKEYVKEHQYDLIGCRVRQATGPWVYRSMAVVINANDTFTFNVQKKVMIVPPLSNVTISCQADRALSSCFFKWPGQQVAVALNESVSTARYKYTGIGLTGGHCGVTLYGVTAAMSGDVFCSAWTRMRPKGYESDTTALIVQTPPTKPILALSYRNYTEGATLRAMCTARNSRPVSNISWYLDQDRIRADDINEASLETSWSWSYNLKTITQTLVRQVTWRDNGKVLQCRADHVAIVTGLGYLSDRATLRVRHSPKVIDAQPIVVEGLDIGDTAEVRVEVPANPQPVFTWQFGNMTIGERDVVQIGRIQAPQGTLSGHSWQARLIISNLKLEDFLSPIVLTAKNDIGLNTYHAYIKGPKTPPTTTIAEPTAAEETAATTADTTANPPPTEAKTPADVSTTAKEYYSSTTSKPEKKGATAQKVQKTSTEKTTWDSDFVTGKPGFKNAQMKRPADNGDSLAGLIVGLLLVAILVLASAAMAWYAHSTSRWCFRRRQFASSQMHEPFVDPCDEPTLDSVQMNL